MMMHDQSIIIPLPAWCLISSELFVRPSVADSETAAASPPVGGEGGTTVELREGMLGGSDAGGVAPLNTFQRGVLNSDSQQHVFTHCPTEIITFELDILPDSPDPLPAILHNGQERGLV